MSNSVEAMYQEIILDHYKNPRGTKPPSDCATMSHQVNPTCGDEVTVGVDVQDGHVSIAYEGVGCSISQASASVMAELLQGHSIDDAARANQAFREMMQSKGQAEPDEDILGDGIAFVGVAKYPARIKCALLPWTALTDACIQAGIKLETKESA